MGEGTILGRPTDPRIARERTGKRKKWTQELRIQDCKFCGVEAASHTREGRETAWLSSETAETSTIKKC